MSSSNMTLLSLVILALIGLAAALTCTNYDSNMGATFDITDLFRTPEQPPYQVEDGDIPCTTNTVCASFKCNFANFHYSSIR
jgi:hypothetical protein